MTILMLGRSQAAEAHCIWGSPQPLISASVSPAVCISFVLSTPQMPLFSVRLRERNLTLLLGSEEVDSVPIPETWDRDLDWPNPGEEEVPSGSVILLTSQHWCLPVNVRREAQAQMPGLAL